MNERHDDHTSHLFVPVPGARVGAYVIREPIGAGGMGEVHLAEDVNLGRKAALKFLPLPLAGNAEFRARFLREARSAAALSHPNIVHIYEVGEFEGRPFIAMEHVDGATLREHVPPGGMPAATALRIITPLAEALAEAHAAGIIHRDIKPSNIVMDRGGRPKLLDFGLAALTGGERVTQIGSTLGTVGYMAPEQIKGQAPEPRSDLFSLGVMLYELLTGRPPFRGDNEAATLHAVLSLEPEPLAPARPDASPALESIVARLLAKDPAGRPASAKELHRELAEELRRLEGSGVNSAPAMSTPRPAAATRKRWRLLVPAAAAAAVIALLFFSPWSSRETSVVPAAQAGENRLVVLYFDNVADPDDPKRLGEIVPSLLISDLSESSSLQVVSTQRLYDILKNLGKEGMKRIDGSVATRVAEKATAKWMLTGKVLQGDPEIVLTAELVETSSGNVVASERISGQPGEKIFSVVGRLGELLREDLELPAAPQGGQGLPNAATVTQSADAYRLWIEGVESMRKLFYEEARAKFLEAVGLDSTFALPYLHLSILARNSEEEKTYARKAARFGAGLGWREQLYIEAQLQAANNGQEGAIAALRRIVDRDPEDKEAWYYLAQAYRGMQRSADAVTALNRVIAIDPSFKLAHNLLAYQYEAMGDLDNSIKAIEEYIRLVPDEPNPYDSQGDLYAYAGRLEEAADSYRKALEIKPDFYMSRLKLMEMRLYAGDDAGARATLRILESDPRPEVRRDLAWHRAFVAGYRGRLNEYVRVMLDDAADDRDTALEGTDSKLAEVGWVLVSLGRAEEALPILERARSLAAPDDFFAFEVSAVAMARLGRFEEADAMASRLAALAADHPGWPAAALWSARGEIAAARGDHAEALAAFRKMNESVVEFYTLERLGRACVEAGDPTLAVPFLERAVRRYDESRRGLPQAVLVHYDLGRAYEAAGRRADALAQYRTFLGIWSDPDPDLTWVADAKERLARLERQT
jgi:serine/threonine protein kinase/tetratricopeptide (TPR) repeat protein